MSEQIEQRIVPVDLEREMKKSYIDYAMSVIVGRALPDVRDGLKPVHRRILYTMYEAGLYPEKGYRKCATTVGDVLGKYHPHGDAAVYDSLVRLAQPFSLRYPLVDGQGNFGSVDGDSPAAYRYTEARMGKITMEMLRDIDRETVNFQPNYDDRLEEPITLPSRFPNILVNGSSGIAVGMATNIPPHNLGEVIDGVIATIDDPEISIDDLMNYIKGPDFPTAGVIMGRSGIRSAYHTGRGRAITRARAEIQEMKNNRQRIVVDEIPYLVNKARLIEKIADLVKEKRVEGISDLRDESDRDGMQIVIELKKDANANVVLNQLYKNTQMQESFGINMLMLVNGEPKTLNLRQVLDHYIVYQKEVVTRRTQYDLRKAEERAHLLEGLRVALDNVDRVVEILRHARSIPDGKAQLIAEFDFSDVQSQAIVDMRMGRLTGLEREKIDNEYADLMVKINDLKAILLDETLLLDTIKSEMLAIKQKYGDERRSAIEAVLNDIEDEDLIPEEDTVITLTHVGYVKRQPVSVYKSQHRGGRGVTGLSTREEDFVEHLFISSTHANIMFFTNMGRVYRLKGYEIPEAGRQAKGTAIVNLLQLEAEERITAVIAVRDFEEGNYLLMTTQLGVIKKTNIMDFRNIRRGGLRAIELDEGDQLIYVKLTDGTRDVLIGTRNGIAIRFKESDVRPTGRMARGVRSIRLVNGDYVTGVSVPKEGSQLLVVTENGYGKKTPIEEYRNQSRGGMGIKTYNLNENTGKVVGVKAVLPDDDLMLITSDGIIIRLSTAEISSMGRITKGVRLMRLDAGIQVSALARIPKTDDEIEEDEENGEDVEIENGEE